MRLKTTYRLTVEQNGPVPAALTPELSEQIVRQHLTLESLLSQDAFNDKVLSLVRGSGR